MKSTLLKTLAATALVATTQADIHVLGTSFKERGVNAPPAPPLPGGTIIPNPGTVQATRGYLIYDSNITGATPSLATYVEYWEVRNAGDVSRFYTVDTDFTNYRADNIVGATGGLRTYGHMHAPVWVADVTNALIPFSGTTLSSGFPRKLSFDQTTYQTGSSDAATGPKIVTTTTVASTFRSVVSGSANPVNVSEASNTIPLATKELVDRLVKQGYVRTAGEAPEITSTFPPTVPLGDGATQVLTVTLDPDVFPVGSEAFAAPTYQWYKDDVAIATGTQASFTLTGGASTGSVGPGTYKVVVTNDLGSATSTDVVVTSVANQFTTNLPATVALAGASSTTLSVVLNPLPVTPPVYQWFKNDVAIAAVDGGNEATYTVTGGTAGITGAAAPGTPYTFRVEITNSVGKLVSGNSIVSVTNVPLSFTTQMPSTLAVSFSGTAILAPVPIANALPKVTTYQWAKATLAVPGTFTDLTTEQGGKAATFTVTGDGSKINGPGVYRLTIGNGSATLPSSTCTVTAAP